MSLTLVELAQAIVDDRKFLFVDLDGYQEVESETAVRYWTDFPDQVSIKPEPREIWFVGNYNARFSSRELAEAARKVEKISEPIAHFKEVIE